MRVGAQRGRWRPLEFSARRTCVFLILASFPGPPPRSGRGVRHSSLPGHSLMAAQSATDQRRALELLAGSAKQGCTEAFLLAHGFTVELLADMVRAGLATVQIERAHLAANSSAYRRRWPAGAQDEAATT